MLRSHSRAFSTSPSPRLALQATVGTQGQQATAPEALSRLGHSCRGGAARLNADSATVMRDKLHKLCIQRLTVKMEPVIAHLKGVTGSIKCERMLHASGTADGSRQWGMGLGK